MSYGDQLRIAQGSAPYDSKRSSNGSLVHFSSSPAQGHDPPPQIPRGSPCAPGRMDFRKADSHMSQIDPQLTLALPETGPNHTFKQLSENLEAAEVTHFRGVAPRLSALVLDAAEYRTPNRMPGFRWPELKRRINSKHPAELDATLRFASRSAVNEGKIFVCSNLI